ncbi:hypothetical protein CS060_11675 [Anoxybacillus flavithermus]|uniref:Radical SAM core domain-containing protein n=3 Tax=Anoxybacillus TaxID=150247 RepID=A0A2G5RMS9_9BACL|nr:hypothetical protein CS060_11675 [Anoxybacillus flavithermus]
MFMFLKFKANTKVIENFEGASIILFREKSILKKDCNKSGLYVLKMCDGLHTFEDIINQINKDFNKISEDQVEATRMFIKEYIDAGIIDLVNDPEGVEINVIGHENLVVPVNVSMEVTNRCQLKCLHCFNESGKKRKGEIEVDKFIELAKVFVEIGVHSFFITGGEPMLKKNVENLISFLGKHACTVTIASNGLLLRERILNILSTFPNIGVQVSLDGLEKNHDFIRGVKGAFNRTVDNIGRMTEKRIPVSISFTMNDYNKDDLEGLIQLCRNLNCLGVSIGLTSNAGRAKTNEIPLKVARDFIDILQNFHRKYTTDDFYVGLDICEKKISKIMDNIAYPNKCGAGYHEIHIMANGEVTPCPAISNIILGDVKQNDIFEILDISNLRRIMGIPSPIRNICGDCQHYDTCGNCIASMFEVSESECKVQREIIKI